MQRLVIIVVNTLLLVPFMTFPAISKPNNDYPDCEKAVADVGKEILSKGAQVDKVEELDISGYSVPTLFANEESKNLQITLGSIISANNRLSDNIMNSKQLKMSYANTILSQCRKYKMFTIKISSTDWITTYFKMPSGAISVGTCLPPGTSGGDKLMWGYEVCY